MASARCVPCSAAANVGASPAAPEIAAIIQSAGRPAASTTAFLAGRRFDPAPGQRVLQSEIMPLIRDDRDLCIQRDRLFGKRLPVCIRCQRDNIEPRAVAFDQIKR